MNQKELQQMAQKQSDIENECFIDVSICGVCGSHEVVFLERQNGVIINCNDCIKYQKWSESR